MIDWGFDVDWSLGQRVNLRRLRREAPRFFRQPSRIETLTVLQSHFNDHLRHLMEHKHFIGKSFSVPVLKGPAASPSTIATGSVTA